MKFLSLIFTFLLSFNIFGQEITIPALRSPVMDEAKFLNPSQIDSLSQMIYEIYTNNGPQITIFTVPDLQGFPIEEFSIRVVEKWQLGTKKNGNGILILISKNDRKMRIEIGQGIEGEITDYDASIYIQKILRPAFKEGMFYEGLDAVLSDISNRFNIKLEGSSNKIIKRRAAPMNSGLFNLIFIIFVASLVTSAIFRKKPLFRGVANGVVSGVAGFATLGPAGIAAAIVFAIIGFAVGIIGLNNILYAMASSSSHGGRGGFYGGGSSGGGGWSGGGGGFSGGGSSGDW